MNLTPPNSAPGVQEIRDRIPEFDIPAKREFLELELFDVPVREICLKLGIPLDRPRLWASHDVEFASWRQQVQSLSRRGLQKEIIQSQYLKTLYNYLQIDAEIVGRYLTDPSQLNDYEQQYMLRVRSLYSMEALANMFKLTGDEQDRNIPLTSGAVNIYIGEDLVTDVVSQQAAAKTLLGIFKRERTLEGEYRLIDNSDA